MMPKPTIADLLADFGEPNRADAVELSDPYAVGYGYDVTLLTEADIEALRAGKALLVTAMDFYTVLLKLEGR